MDFIILALATFRISSLIADEDGPLGLFEWVRGVVGVQRDEKGENYGKNNFAVGLVCILCNSIWVGTMLTLLFAYYKQIVVWIAFPLALSAIAMVLGLVMKLLNVLIVRCDNG